MGIKIKYQEREVAGQVVPHRIVIDGHIRLGLEDGAELDLKPIVVNVIKTNEKSDTGDRLYIVQHMVVINLRTPPKEDQQ